MVQESRLMLEVTAEKPMEDGYYYASLYLPATKNELEDARQRARLTGRDVGYVGIEITGCPQLPALVDTRLDCPTVDELNFFAKRLASISSSEMIALGAIFSHRKERGDYENGLSMKELINLTYGLDNVMVAANVEDNIALGRFAIENEMHHHIPGLKDVNPKFLNVQQIGQEIRDMDGGLFYCGCYVVAGEYEYQEVYDGENLPKQTNEDEFAVFSITLREKTDETTPAKDILINLPMERDYLEKFLANKLSAPLENYEVVRFESAIPYINRFMLMEEMDINTINDIAYSFKQAREFDQIKFKAAMEGFKIQTSKEALDILSRISEYQLAHYCNDEVDFFKEYLTNNMDGRFDAKWLKNIPCDTSGRMLLERTGAVVTEYGIISKGRGNMFAPISYDEPEETQTESEDEEMEEAEEEIEEHSMGGLSM